MALFENFPYTDLHQLNLDWLINELNIVKERSVLSVNGLTGEVILYEDPAVIFPEINQAAWSIFRTADGVERGITFGSDGKAYIMNANVLHEVYTDDNQPPYPVTSVNGQTGDVVLYQQQYVRLPDLDDVQMTNWNLFRHLNNVTSGIQFEDDGKAYIMLGSNRYEIYTSLNPSPSDVTSVNGQTGAVVLYQSNQVQLPPIDDAGITFWNIYRFVNSGAYGIQFNTDGTIDLIQPNATRYKIYTANDQPPYPVTSVNNQTGDVVLTIPDQLVNDADDDYLQVTSDASAYSWGFMRDTDGGNIGISFDYSGGTAKTYLRYYDANDQIYKTTQLLSINDIPGSSVVSVNGQAGVVVLTGEDIDRSSTDSTDLDQALTNIESGLNLIINGDTCSSNVSAGDFVQVVNSTVAGITDGMYQAVNNKTANTTFLTGDLASFTAGALNELNKKHSDLFVNNSTSYVNVSTDIPYNSSYTCPARGLYILRVAGNGSITGTWYMDIARQNVLLSTRSADDLYCPVFLEKGAIIYTKNSSSGSYRVVGYYEM